MNTQKRIALLENELSRLKLRIKLEKQFRIMHTLFRLCVRCNRFQDPKYFAVIFTGGKHGAVAHVRFHSYCNECRATAKKLKRQETFNREMADKFWE